MALASACAFATPAAPRQSPTLTAASRLPRPISPAGVGEIIVTAQRRSENLQDVPVSVGDHRPTRQLAAINTGGADIRGLSGRVPSLNIESSFGRTFPRFYIRGLGNTDFDLNASQPVSLVYDDVVLENPILKGFPAFDVDRRRSAARAAGHAVRPQHAGRHRQVRHASGRASGRNYARVSYGTYSTINAEGAVGGEISDNDRRSRCPGLWQHRNDWIDNLDEPGKHDLEGYDDVALRGAVPVQADRRADVPAGRPASRPRRRRAHLPRQRVRAAAATIWSALDGGDFERDEVRDRRNSISRS